MTIVGQTLKIERMKAEIELLRATLTKILDDGKRYDNLPTMYRVSIEETLSATEHRE